MTESVASGVVGGAVKERPGLRVSDEFDGVMSRIAACAPLIRRDGARGEELGRPTPEVIEALMETGVFLAAVPREAGGYEFSPLQLLAVMEELAWYESSTAWTVLGVIDTSGMTAAFLDDVAVEEYFGEGRSARLSGQGTRPGKATRVDGGYIVSGSWQFNSGSPVSTHIHTAILGDDGRAFIATLPVDQVTHIDNWDVLGLRASGSHDYRIDDVFVADTHMYAVMDPEQRRGGALYRAGLANVASLQHAGWALGTIKRMLEEIRALSAEKAGRPGVATSTDEFYGTYAELEARYRGVRAFLVELWSDVETTLDAGGELSTEQISLIHLGTITAKRTAQSIANDMATWSGSSLLRAGVIQRYFRDVYTGVQHLLCSPPVQQAVGKQLAGRAAGAHWEFYDLIEPGGAST